MVVEIKKQNMKKSVSLKITRIRLEAIQFKNKVNHLEKYEINEMNM